MQFRTGTMDDVAMLGAAHALRARDLQQPLPARSHCALVCLAATVAVCAAVVAGRMRSGRGRAGWLLGFGVFDADANEVDALFVNPDHGGQGIGQALMQRLLAMADREREVVLSASLNAVPFYQRQGFVSVREEAYPHPSGVALASVSMRRPW